MDELRDKVAALVEDSMGDPNYYDPVDALITADRILAIPEIAEALKAARADEAWRQVNRDLA